MPSPLSGTQGLAEAHRACTHAGREAEVHGASQTLERKPLCALLGELGDGELQ